MTNDLCSMTAETKAANPRWKEIVAQYQQPAVRRALWQVANTPVPYAALWRETVPVHETFEGKTVWHRHFEVLALTGLPKLNALTPGPIGKARTTRARGSLPFWKCHQWIRQNEPFLFIFSRATKKSGQIDGRDFRAGGSTSNRHSVQFRAPSGQNTLSKSFSQSKLDTHPAK
jgi:hypothetical protein